MLKRMKTSVPAVLLAVLFLAAMLFPAQGYLAPSAEASAFETAQEGEDFGGSCGGSAMIGAPSPSTTWYFAAGCSEGDYRTVIDIANPGGTQANVNVVFYTDVGEIAGPNLSVAPRSSETIDLFQYLTTQEVGAKITSSQPVIAQRTIFGEGRIETDLGATSLSTKYYFTEGYAGSGFNEYLSVINPNDTDMNCTLKYYTAVAGVITKTHQVKKKSRLTVSVNEDLSAHVPVDVALELTTPQPVYAERKMTFTRNDHPGMSIAAGSSNTATDWYFPPMSTGAGFEAWHCVFNPGDNQASVNVDFIMEGQAALSQNYVVPGRARFTINVNDSVGPDKKTAIRVHADRPVASELATYFDYQSAQLDGVCTGGTCLPGSATIGKKFYLPGGTVGDRHEQWINLANFGGSSAAISVKAYTSAGTITKDYTVPSMRSKIVNANQDILASGDIYAIEASSGSDFLAGKADFYSSAGVPVPPGAEQTWYFAEGCTREGFSEWLCLQNPGDSEIEVHAVYMLFGAEPKELSYPVAAHSRNSINVESAVGPGQDVSVMLWSENEFYAERPMYFDYKQSQPGYSWEGGHVTFGVTSPRTKWYFAEGCTRDGFEEWLCIQNPTDTEAQVYIDYVLAGAPTQQRFYPVPPRSRFSVSVNADVAPGQDVSAYVHSNVPIVCERPMYFNYSPVYNGGIWPGGHVVMGASSPSIEWYFAEGCTRSGFEEWICIQNPNPAEANLHVTYATSGGVVEKDYQVQANSRHTLSLNAELGPDLDVSCHISSDQPIICERPLYFNYTGYGAPGWNGGSAELGVSSSKTEWYFAEGFTGTGFQEWICIQNTGSEEAEVMVTYNIQGEGPREKVHSVPPGRYTIFVNSDAGPDLQLSACISSDHPVICERSMYFDYGGWNGGHCASGYAP